ncbi:MAG: hypothetical protein AAGF11_37790, partial [Myxococcota bacterium]
MSIRAGTHRQDEDRGQIHRVEHIVRDPIARDRARGGERTGGVDPHLGGASLLGWTRRVQRGPLLVFKHHHLGIGL